MHNPRMKATQPTIFPQVENDEKDPGPDVHEIGGDVPAHDGPEQPSQSVSKCGAPCTFAVWTDEVEKKADVEARMMLGRSKRMMTFFGSSIMDPTGACGFRFFGVGED